MKILSLYTDDAIAFPPGSGMLKGRTAIEAMWRSEVAGKYVVVWDPPSKTSLFLAH
jgi:ketosteroid isomerase-like protein